MEVLHESTSDARYRTKLGFHARSRDGIGCTKGGRHTDRMHETESDWDASDRRGLHEIKSELSRIIMRK